MKQLTSGEERHEVRMSTEINPQVLSEAAFISQPGIPFDIAIRDRMRVDFVCIEMVIDRREIEFKSLNEIGLVLPVRSHLCSQVDFLKF